MEQFHDDIESVVIITSGEGKTDCYEFHNQMDSETFSKFADRYNADVKMYNLWGFRNLYKHKPARSAKDHNVYQ